MGLFDKLFNSNSQSFDFTPRTELDAWVGIFYACASIDGEVSEIESDLLNQCLVFKSWFDTSETEYVMQPYRKAQSVISVIGSHAIIDACIGFISEDRKNTLFCFIVEVLMVDGVLADAEKEIIEYLQNKLNISDEIAIKILDVFFIRNKGNKILY